MLLRKTTFALPLSLIHSSLSFSHEKLRLSPSGLTPQQKRRSIMILQLDEQIDRQSDKSKYGRGINHISADLNEGDIIAYQDGTWYVDGTEVGNGSPATVRYVLVDTVQIVWTHDCEHGLVYGFDLIVAGNDGQVVSCDASGPIIEKGSIFIIQDEYVQCGPEQILCRIPTVSATKPNWKEFTKQAYVAIADFDPEEEMMRA
ncbi:hypothetical protein ACHAXM_003962 [Skeletonema potamos]